MIASDRAYIHFSGCKWISHLDAATNKIFWRIHPRWINSGNTPTRGLIVYAKYEFLDEPLDPNFTFTPEDYVPTQLSMAPKGEIISRHGDFSGEDLKSVKEGKKHLYVWGVAHYRDVFPGTSAHITKFCAYASDLAGDPTKHWNKETNPFDIAFKAHTRHNCADEEC